ncbi:hypothetical protein Tsubulata_026050 [Turnera subulata]|uniref:Uncharacterized protein n=1 Tax=Turnera subulata TaxID=218843 RepID=A0A9Q0G7B1_9ROSI|nr:hypothetical protein Tsubulata_026050 [Turnera subulata]
MVHSRLIFFTDLSIPQIINAASGLKEGVQSSPDIPPCPSSTTSSSPVLPSPSRPSAPSETASPHPRSLHRGGGGEDGEGRDFDHNCRRHPPLTHPGPEELKRVRFLRIELLSGELGIDDGMLLKLRVIWTISSLIAASARHYLLLSIIDEHKTLTTWS